MSTTDWISIGFYFFLLLCGSVLLGRWMAITLSERSCRFRSLQNRIEHTTGRICGFDASEQMSWQRYACCVLVFNCLGMLVLYALQRTQGWLPMNEGGFTGLSPDLAFNTAVSFTTNTNWQAYSGESTMSGLTQMMGLTVQNFLSAATGIAVLMAFTRGLTAVKSENSEQSPGLGSYWTDMTRVLLFVLLPLSIGLSIALVSQGVVQSLKSSVTVPLLQPLTTQAGDVITEQKIPMGLAASQVAIKQLGTNGGGFFGVNSAHPFENPTPLSNLLQLLAILLIPAASCEMFGILVGDVRQGRTLLAAMLIIFIPCLAFALKSEFKGNQRFGSLSEGGDQSLKVDAANLEGKEVRIGIAHSVLWAVATTAASNGSVNCMHDSLMPLTGMTAIWLMQMGEVVFGGVGCGLYGMIIFAIVAVFISGLMVGRSPEYLGLRIEAKKMKLAALCILIPSLFVLVGTAVSVLRPEGAGAVSNPGPHAFSQILYAFSSAANNNGSAFAGLSVNAPFYNVLLCLAMLIPRYWLIVPVLAIGGSLAGKTRIPVSSGTLPTNTPLFALLLAGVVVLVGALTFIPALVLGPVAEHLQLISASH